MTENKTVKRVSWAPSTYGALLTQRNVDVFYVPNWPKQISFRVKRNKTNNIEEGWQCTHLMLDNKYEPYLRLGNKDLSVIKAVSVRDFLDLNSGILPVLGYITYNPKKHSENTSNRLNNIIDDLNKHADINKVPERQKPLIDISISPRRIILIFIKFILFMFFMGALARLTS
jgi:hypothetical protein